MSFRFIYMYSYSVSAEVYVISMYLNISVFIVRYIDAYIAVYFKHGDNNLTKNDRRKSPL